MGRIEIGAPLREGIYTIKVTWAKLVNATPEYSDNQFFEKGEIGKIDLKPDETGAQLRKKCLELYNEKNPESQITTSDFALRNPSYDFG